MEADKCKCLRSLKMSLVFGLLYAVNGRAVDPARIKLFIDCDPGVDDAEALVLALAQPNVDVLGITVTNGNTDINHVLINAIRVIQAMNRTDVPLYAGTAKPILGVTSYLGAPYYFGRDGFGDVSDFPPVNVKSAVRSTHGVNALVEVINQHPGEVTLVALGSLTNLILAARIDPQFLSKLKTLVVMGGNELGVNKDQEFNFACDPEAAYVIVRESPSLKLFPFDTCIRDNFTMAARNKWMSIGTPQAQLLTKGSRTLTDMMTNHTYPYTDYVSCDPMAMAVALFPDVIKTTIDKSVTIDLINKTSRGVVIADQSSTNNNVHYIHEVDSAEITTLLTDAFSK